MTFTRRISFTPGYQTNPDIPEKGQHPMHMAFILKSDKGALVFDINTGWYLAHKYRNQSRPSVWSLVAHRHLDSNPNADESDMCDHCDLIDEPCVAENLYGLTSPVHDELFLTLLRDGEEVLWARLEAIYAERM